MQSKNQVEFKSGPVKLAFTLVELIVVIIILAILGTIAFISLQGYSTQARDSTRVSDLSVMKTSLGVFQLDSGKYPIPTDGVDITYSGATVWTQGMFGETVFNNVDKLDKNPVDPITGSYYTYSVTQNRGEYQLGGMVEGDSIVFFPLLSSPYKGSGLAQKVEAGEVEARALVTGTYNGQVTKSLSGSTLCNILAVPTIITNDTSIIDLEIINTQNRFVYTGKNNLPSSFKSSKFNNEGGFSFQLNKLVAYSDTKSCSSLLDKTNPKKRLEMLKGIQEAYSGTSLKDEGEIKNILDLSIDVNNPSNNVLFYAGNFVNNNLGGKVNVGDNKPSVSTGNCSAGSQIFDYTGTDQYITIPTGCNITAKLWGAGGGGSGAGTNKGGGGGYVYVEDYDLGLDRDITVIVGEGGRSNSSQVQYSGGGGGRAEILQGTTRLFVAGGGGGASGGGDSSGTNGCNGGAGGGLIGIAGTTCTNAYGSYGGGSGGTQISPGVGGHDTAGYGTNGNDGIGPNGGPGGTTTIYGGGTKVLGGAYGNGGLGGGGGGYYGGGSGVPGQWYGGGGGGGGGSSYLISGATGSIQSGSGSSPGNIGDSDRGIAGLGGVAGNAGTPGRVVISWQ